MRGSKNEPARGNQDIFWRTPTPKWPGLAWPLFSPPTLTHPQNSWTGLHHPGIRKAGGNQGQETLPHKGYQPAHLGSLTALLRVLPEGQEGQEHQAPEKGRVHSRAMGHCGMRETGSGPSFQGPQLKAQRCLRWSHTSLAGPRHGALPRHHTGHKQC